MKENDSILSISKAVNVVVSVAAKKDNKYILVEEAKKEIAGLWNFPAGKVKLGEDLIAAAKREFLEETGYQCEITGLSGINYFYWDDMPGLTIRFNFLGEIGSERQKNVASDIQSTSWHTLDEIFKLSENNLLRPPAAMKQLKEIAANKIYPLDLIG